MGNPYYRMLGLMGDNGLRLGLATLESYDQERFEVEGKRASIAGRAAGMRVSPSDEGGLFLCAGDGRGWFVLCRLEEC